ncbi:MAG: bifunctional hydroxymethylpyrimidine kinase/phosphomethylpyrimidine kinase [Thermodesulfovibrionaceae bacterium]
MKKFLTIGGSDPTSGAGIQMDLKVFDALGAYGLCIITAATAQNTEEFISVNPLPENIVTQQFEVILKDIKIDGAKTGLLFSKDIVHCVVKYMKKYEIKNLVVDPIVKSSTGALLIEEDALEILKNELIPISKAVTANVPEAEVLTDVKIKKISDMYKAAEILHRTGTSIAIIKGGHLQDRAVDILFDGRSFYVYESEKVLGEFHGTGCAFSSAFLFFLAVGYEPKDALKYSKAFVKRAIENSIKLGHGMKILITPKEETLWKK